jgi:hypothetical protein
MEYSDTRRLPGPLVFLPENDPAAARRIYRQAKQGRLRKLYAGIYATDATARPEQIVRQNLLPILGRIAPGAVISHRSAFELKPSAQGEFFLTAVHRRTIQLPGMTLRILPGPPPLSGDHPFMAGLHLASEARRYLENLQHSRARGSGRKTLDRAELEHRLTELARIRGESALNRLLDEARTLAQAGHFTGEFQRLEHLIGALLGTRRARLSAPTAIALAAGQPYDAQRLELFQTLAAALLRTPLPLKADALPSGEPRELQAFCEAYFSNFIEGTRFELDEAHAIVFEGRLGARPKDAHDVLGTYACIMDPGLSAAAPRDAEAYVAALCERHTRLMRGRPEAIPGTFKQVPNRAGSTVFVEPPLVTGTLARGVELLRGLDDPPARAAFAMFVVAEVHPFNDGNGRVARLAMNAELSRAGLRRWIVPTVLRDDYLLALRALSRNGDPQPYIRMLARVAQFSHWLEFARYADLRRQLETSGAMLEPSEGQLRIDEAP